MFNDDRTLMERWLDTAWSKIKVKRNRKFSQFLNSIKSNQIPDVKDLTKAEIQEYTNKKCDRKANTPLHIATNMENFKVLEFLVQNCDFTDLRDRNGNTPLLIAIGNEDKIKTQILIEHGANPNTVDFSGSSPIEILIVNENCDLLRYLLDQGLSSNLCTNENDQMRLLHVASSVGSLKQARLLIEYGASFQVQNVEGQSPIHMAAMSDNVDIVELLIISGDDINHPDVDELTPLNYARLYNAEKVDEYLTKNNAQLRDDILFERGNVEYFDN